MIISTTASKTLLQGWERVLLALPALAGLLLGFLLVFVPERFAAITQFPADDSYIYQLAGAAILGYGTALSISVFQYSWLAVRLVVIGVLINNLGSLYACVVAIFTTQAPNSVFVFLITSLVFVGICSLLLARHSNVPQPEATIRGRMVQLFLIIGAIAAGAFGILPLFAPTLFRIFHLHINAPFIVQQAGAASLGYAVVAVMAQRARTSEQLRLSTLMAAIFNGVGGIVSLPVVIRGDVLFLPWIIAPVGLAVMVVCIILLGRMIRKEG